MDFRIWLAGLIAMLAVQFFGIGKVKPPEEMSISGEWLFQTGDLASWRGKNFDDSRWARIQVPSTWENQGYAEYDGIAWYRYHVEVPSGWKKQGGGIMFEIGKIDDDDEFYFNGYFLGRSYGWQTWRKYFIPKNLINYGGDNVIAIKVVDTGGGGGIWEGPLKIFPGSSRRFNVEEY